MSNLQIFHMTVQRTSPPFFSVSAGSAVSVVDSTAGMFSIDDLPSGKHFLTQSIEAKISYIDGEYLAEFAEAEIVTSGETAEEAIQWLKETIVSLYEYYNSNRETLGPLPGRQLNILEAYIAEK